MVVLGSTSARSAPGTRLVMDMASGFDRALVVGRFSILSAGCKGFGLVLMRDNTLWWHTSADGETIGRTAKEPASSRKVIFLLDLSCGVA